MPRYHVTLSFDGVNITQVKKKATEFFGEHAEVAVEKVVNPTSRSDRYSEAQSEFENAKSEVESLKQELEDWKDNLPENLQQGTKADELDDAIQTLEQVLDNMENVTFEEVTFPGMF